MSKLTSARGSILIWTLLMGISLATVFFYFSQRLNSNMAAQRETIEYQNARLYFESYVAYILSLDHATLETMRGDIDFDNGEITGTLTNAAETLTGVLDSGDSVQFSAAFGGLGDRVKVQWDACPGIDLVELITIDGSEPVFVTGGCDALGYENTADTTLTSFTLSAPGAPTSYQLTAITYPSAVLYGPEWTLQLEQSIGFRRKLVTNISFTPDS